MMLSLLLVTFNARGSTELGYCLLVRMVKQAYYVIYDSDLDNLIIMIDESVMHLQTHTHTPHTHARSHAHTPTAINLMQSCVRRLYNRHNPFSFRKGVWLKFCWGVGMSQTCCVKMDTNQRSPRGASHHQLDFIIPTATSLILYNTWLTATKLESTPGPIPNE